jgi:hypothetical protein
LKSEEREGGRERGREREGEREREREGERERGREREKRVGWSWWLTLVIPDIWKDRSLRPPQLKILMRP